MQNGLGTKDVSLAAMYNVCSHGKTEKNPCAEAGMKKKAKKEASPEKAVRKEDLNRVRGTVAFIDPERRPTRKSSPPGPGWKKDD